MATTGVEAGSVGFADLDSARRAVAVLEQADEFFRTGVPPLGALGVGGDRLALVVPGTPDASGSNWSPGRVWHFNDGSTAGAVAATDARSCWIRDLWLKPLPPGSPILLGYYTGEKNIGGDRRPTYRTVGPWPIRKQKVVTQIGCSGSSIQYTWKEVWVIDFPVP